MLTKILHYGFHRPEDFDKYEALRLSEQLAISARLASDPKALIPRALFVSEMRNISPVSFELRPLE
jgi:hypothetical protein